MTQKDPASENAWIRGLTQPRISRRQLMRGAAGVAATASLGSVLAACGVGGTENTGADEDFDWTAWWAEQKPTDKLVFANWPLYIDTAKGKYPSIEKFTRETGIKVAYKPVIQGNAEFFSKISPVLQAGDPIGYDIIAVADGWQLTQLMENRWLIPLDHEPAPQLQRIRRRGGNRPRLRPRSLTTWSGRRASPESPTTKTSWTARSTASKSSSTRSTRARSA